MSVLPANTSALPPTESLFYAGWLKGNYRQQTVATGGLLGIGGNFTGPWEDVSGYCEFRLATYSDVGSAVGGVLIQWSFDGVNVHATEAAGTAVGLAVYDSGILAYHYPYVRVNYTNNGVGAQLVAFQLRVIVSPTAVGGGGGGAPIIGIVGQGAPGPVALAWPVELTAPQESLSAPNPSAIVGPLAAGLLEPDRALRTRARVLTDEGAFSDDFPNAAIARGLTGGATIAVAGTVVTGVGSLFTTEVREGDYFFLTADTFAAAVQVASIQSNLAMTLVAAYGGGVGPAVGSIQNYAETVVGLGAAITVAGSVASLFPARAAGAQVSLLRTIAVGGRKGCAPLHFQFYGNQDQIRATQFTVFGLVNLLPADQGFLSIHFLKRFMPM